MQPQLCVRSANAKELAHRIAKREGRTIALIVERALESYEARHLGLESAASFYNRLSQDYGTDIDLDARIREGRVKHPGIYL